MKNLKNIELQHYFRMDSKTRAVFTLEEIFKNIKTLNKGIPKNDRRGYMFACRSENSGRHKVDVTSFTGIIFVDIDGVKSVPDKKANSNKIKEILFNFGFTIGTWLSSGNNVHALIRVPVCETGEEYELRWEALKRLLSRYLDKYIEPSKLYDKGIYIGALDRATRNYVQISYEGYDPDILINYAAKPFIPIANSIDPYNKVHAAETRRKPFKIGGIYRDGNGEIKDKDKYIKVVQENILNELIMLSHSGHETNMRKACNWAKVAQKVGIGYNDALDWYLYAISQSDYLMNRSTDKKNGSERTAKQIFNSCFNS